MAGIAAELNGGTHMSFEDIGVMRSIPNMVIFEPVDIVQLEKALPKIIDYDGPIYVRFFRKFTPTIFKEDYKFNLFKGDLIKEGQDITIIASGIMVYEALLAREILKDNEIEAEIINIHTIKPIDRNIIIESVKKTNGVVVCENHNILGGLGSATAEVFSENYPTKIKFIGIRDTKG